MLVEVEVENLDDLHEALDAGATRILLDNFSLEELAQAEQAVKQANARRDLLTVDVERHEIRAPVDGIFLKDLADFGGMNETYKSFLTEPYPTRTTVQVGLPEGMLIEVDCIALVPDKD